MIRFLFMDVDGTLTDGKIYIGKNDEIFKAFNVKDGYAIKNSLLQVNIIPVVITARISEIVTNRCQELGIKEVYQGINDKKEQMDKILKKFSILENKEYDYSSIAYIGDDILDLQCMFPIKEAGGYVGCPKNSCKEVIQIADFISIYNGGDGAVREFIEWIIALN